MISQQDSIKHELQDVTNNLHLAIKQINNHLLMKSNLVVDQQQLYKSTELLERMLFNTQSFLIGEEKYSPDEEDKLLANAKQLSRSLQEFNQLDDDSEKLLKILGSICPLWPFC